MPDRADISEATPVATTDPIRYRRWYKIVARTFHLVSTSILLGAHVIGAAKGSFRVTLYVAVISGLAMYVLEAHPNRYLKFEAWELLLFVKLFLLLLIVFFWDYGVPILILVMVIAAVGSHMPRSARHWKPGDIL